MKLVTQTEALGQRLGDFAAVQLLGATGFDALDFSMFQMRDPNFHLNGPDRVAYARKLRVAATEAGVSFEQSHSPFPVYNAEDAAFTKHMFDTTVRALEISCILGVKTMVVHPFHIPDPVAQLEQNLDFYGRLLPYCMEFDIQVALENMWTWDTATNHAIPNVCSTGESFAAYMDAVHGLSADYFTACLDLGHCGMVGETAQGMIAALGSKRLTALHVHDNDNYRDSHTLPYLGAMDWDAITAALRDVQYKGNFTFEADSFFAPFPDELLAPAAQFMATVGRSLMAKITPK